MTYNPYSKGRWYRAFIESNGTNISLTSCDIEGSAISSGKLKLVKDFHILDTVYDITSETGSTNTLSSGVYTFNDGIQGVSLPTAAVMSSAYIYIFGYVAE